MSKNDEFRIKNETLCIKNEEFCIQNDEFCRIRPGFDSHVVNGGTELVIYATAQILPAYVIHWTPAG